MVYLFRTIVATVRRKSDRTGAAYGAITNGLLLIKVNEF